MRILAIHGVGHADARSDWQPLWTQAVQRGLQAWGVAAPPQIRFLAYDPFFEQAELDTRVVLSAFARLSASGLFHGIGDLLRNRSGLRGALQDLRWSAGMVAQWTALERLRAQLREHLAAEVRAHPPELVLAHSLGSLIAYDTFRRDEVAHPGASMLRGATLLTFGSQIGNAAVRGVFGGRIEPVQEAHFWWHLFNEHDDVFTTPLALPLPDRFRQIDTPFDTPGLADHDGDAYLAHDNAAVVWQDLARRAGRALPGAAVPVRPGGRVEAASGTAPVTVPTPQKRALLVGIGSYPDPAAELAGAVNDVFSMSAALQELGFPADSIRVVLDERATAAAIRERLRWLLADAGPDDDLFFYFAGHGAQIPGYGQDAEVDHIDECLVPYDFDWSLERAITDDEFADLYGQLPYGCRFTAVLDCCHAGGMTRAGGARTRGLAPPDDIRHRMMRWDRAHQVWVPRAQLADRPGARRAVRAPADQAQWLGTGGSLRRLGRGSSLWLPTAQAFDAATRDQGHLGGYAPVIIEACGESELAYEYRHGVTSYGAFTYSLCAELRDAARRPRGRAAPTLEQLVRQTAARMALVLPEAQTPVLHCPAVWRGYVLPGL